MNGSGKSARSTGGYGTRAGCCCSPPVAQPPARASAATRKPKNDALSGPDKGALLTISPEPVLGSSAGLERMMVVRPIIRGFQVDDGLLVPRDTARTDQERSRIVNCPYSVSSRKPTSS